jgi:hypothetical protein
MLPDSAHDDKGVIGILENMARKIINKKEQTLSRGHKKKLLKDVGYDIKKKGG